MRLSSLTRFLAALAASAAVAGCATPQYQTTVHLVPPTDAQGRACVAACEVQKTACQTDCQTRYQACSAAVEPQVETRYVEALKLYETGLRQYASALRHYELQMQFNWWHGPSFYHPYWMHSYWMRPYPMLPPYRAPEMPTREGIRAHLLKSNCEEDCGCLPAYDSCFVACGGQRVSETTCIRNCPPAR